MIDTRGLGVLSELRTNNGPGLATQIGPFVNLMGKRSARAEAQMAIRPVPPEISRRFESVHASLQPSASLGGTTGTD
jgi:hypothetical protein